MEEVIETETKIWDEISGGMLISPAMLKRMKQTWIETYMALNLICGREEDEDRDRMKIKLAEANEAVMKFFDQHIPED